MVTKRVFTPEFVNSFNGTVILDKDIESKLNNKHKVYKEDLIDALGDPYLVVMKTSHKSPPSLTGESKSRGKVYEILCETENGQVLFIVGRLFPDGNLYIITAYWVGTELEKLYRQESEVLRNE